MADINVSGIDLSNGQFRAVTSSDVITNDDGTTALAGITIQNSGTPVGTQPAINVIQGSNITLSVVNDVGNNRVNITISSAAVTDTSVAMGDAVGVTVPGFTNGVTIASAFPGGFLPRLGILVGGISTGLGGTVLGIGFKGTGGNGSSTDEASMNFIISGATGASSAALLFSGNGQTIVTNSFPPAGNFWTVNSGGGGSTYAGASMVVGAL